MLESVRYPAPGCIVEYLEGNAVQIAMVMEEAGGKLRLFLPNRRETRLASGRLLPWLGPLHEGAPGKDEMARLLEVHKARRETAAAAVPVGELWELAQGEVEAAPALWFAELMETAPGPDEVAAYGRALLACKSHFRFQPPDFLVYDAETVERRLAEQKAREEREALVAGGAAFLRLLWEAASGRRELPPPGDSAFAAEGVPWPAPEVAERLKALLRARMIDPETQEDDALWRLLAKGLPDVPHLPLQLLMAWGELPPHHDFWLDRAGYDAGDAWWRPFASEVAGLAAGGGPALPGCELPFISIDSAATRDVDDAFYVEEKPDGGWDVTVALACPAASWPFGSPLDRAVLHRATSIYLPEGDCHMLPEQLGTDAWSLRAGEERPAFCVRAAVDSAGRIGECRFFAARARLAANLAYPDAQAVLDGRATPGNPAAPHAAQLRMGLALARARQAARIAAGAIVMDRPEPQLALEGEGRDTTVRLFCGEPTPDAQMLVAELMILASAALAEWGAANHVPLLHRTQDVAVPREYAGVWTRPEDMARILRALIPSSLEVAPRPHAALALPRYAPVTSPLRRYPDLVNEAQALHMLATGTPRWDAAALSALLEQISPALDAAGQVQRFRPRYWKLLYFRQQGDKAWWPGVITEENEAFATVSLPEQGLFVRARRKLFDERATPGMRVQVRLGKVQPLYNEIQILEVAPADEDPPLP
ncbi:ribonuclease catalytic domain-containing protein [Desulfovibrio sp.]|uniref:ribonuclease catalytic domain-containing protein n=1 Tax=Desulfovibrio sp. TaxID=885 RepID=UPI0023CA04B2|nr:ribonuclease catalytic domain-containing protein [Desulfovibrio sp.]MDE7242067.1 RNB domain-containing ribonuclease [Desulfovibrio sp.]